MIRHFSIKIFILLFLASYTFAASHIHHDNPDHEHECEICIIVNHFHSADIPHTPVYLSLVQYSFDEISLQSDYFFKLTHKGYYSTAPPCISFSF
jgi:hypothetical protein